MSKIRILIVDDVESQIEQNQAALVHVAEDYHDDLANRRAVVAELFEIKTCFIVGQALTLLETWQPHLAIVDLRFDSLTNSFVEKRGYDPVTEITPTRGLDLIKTLRNNYPQVAIVAYTARGFDALVYNDLRDAGVLGADFFLPLFQKDTSLFELTERAHQVLKNVVEQFNFDLTALRTAYAAGDWPEEALLDLPVQVGDTDVYKMRHFAAHLAVLNNDGTLTYPALRAFVEELISAEEAEATPLIPGFTPNGLWANDWVGVLIEGYLQSTDYKNTQHQINVNAANTILKIIQANRTNSIIGSTNYNIGTTSFAYGHPGQTDIFHNALTIRRVLLGFTRLLETKGISDVFIPYNYKGIGNTPNSNAYDTIFRFGNLGTPSYDNERRVISKILGLSLQNGYVYGPQRLNINENVCLPEELAFLNTYLPVIGERFVHHVHRSLQFDPFEPFKK